MALAFRNGPQAKEWLVAGSCTIEAQTDDNGTDKCKRKGKGKRTSCEACIRVYSRRLVRTGARHNMATVATVRGTL